MQTLEMYVDKGHGQHEEKGGEDERPSGRQRTESTFLQVADPHHDLGGERAWHGLAERHPVHEVFRTQPPAPLHKVPLDVADRSYGSAEPPRPES